jgi:predicted metalloendopeptidase
MRKATFQGCTALALEIKGAPVYPAAMLRKLILALAIGTACSGTPMAEPRSGIDLSAIDPSVRPQDNFWLFANGKWLAATPIPADRAAWNTFQTVYETTQRQLRDAIEGIDPGSAEGSESRKLADFYGSFTDEARVETAGLDGLRDPLGRIHGLRDKAALPSLFGDLARLWVRTPFGVDVSPDERDATVYVAHLEQGRLGLPDRDYYLKDDAHFQAIRKAYREHIVKLLTLAGEPAAEAGADGIVAIETALARLQWTRVQTRDPIKTYNKSEVAALPALLAQDDWPSYLAAVGATAEIRALVVAQPSYLEGLGAVIRETPLESWRAYLAYNLLSSYAPYLTAPFVAEDFAFEQHTLRGVPEIQPRWKRAVAMVDRLGGFALGRLYVERYFPPANKARADALIANLMAAYRESIAALDWMGPETRREALAKLDRIEAKIAYPMKWRDYSGLEIRRDDLIGNVMRARMFDHAFWMAKLGRKVDRAEWRTAPQTVNAYYSPGRNDITFPAGILQPPFFDATADDAANYGGIGTVIGHEISHAFDDQGSRFDGEGNLRNWWTEQDRSRFDARTASLVAQYDAFSPLPGYHVNGALTLGENVADNAGIAIAARAYRLSLGGCAGPVIDGFGGEQRLFIAFAQIWRDKMRDAARIERLKVDPHSPGQFRANGSLRNQGAFDIAFDVKPGDAMYLSPEQRISLWQVDRDLACKEKAR